MTKQQRGGTKLFQQMEANLFFFYISATDFMPKDLPTLYSSHMYFNT